MERQGLSPAPNRQRRTDAAYKGRRFYKSPLLVKVGMAGLAPSTRVVYANAIRRTERRSIKQRATKGQGQERMVLLAQKIEGRHDILRREFQRQIVNAISRQRMTVA